MLREDPHGPRQPVFLTWPLALLFLLLTAALTASASSASPAGEAIGRANPSRVNGPGSASVDPATPGCSVASGSTEARTGQTGTLGTGNFV